MTKILLLTLILCATAITSTAMATDGLQWSYRLGTDVYPSQVVSDGAGGVVIAYPSGGLYMVTWLDRKGNILYHFSDPTFLYIMSTHRRAIVLFHQSGPDFQIVTVNRRGQRRVTHAPDTDFFDFPSMALNLRAHTPSDRRGYFATRVNKASSHVYIERYTYR